MIPSPNTIPAPDEGEDDFVMREHACHFCGALTRIKSHARAKVRAVIASGAVDPETLSVVCGQCSAERRGAPDDGRLN